VELDDDSVVRFLHVFIAFIISVGVDDIDHDDFETTLKSVSGVAIFHGENGYSGEVRGIGPEGEVSWLFELDMNSVRGIIAADGGVEVCFDFALRAFECSKFELSGIFAVFCDALSGSGVVIGIGLTEGKAAYKEAGCDGDCFEIDHFFFSGDLLCDRADGGDGSLRLMFDEIVRNVLVCG
jgi:hypothetical protein